MPCQTHPDHLAGPGALAESPLCDFAEPARGLDRARPLSLACALPWVQAAAIAGLHARGIPDTASPLRGLFRCSRDLRRPPPCAAESLSLRNPRKVLHRP